MREPLYYRRTDYDRRLLPNQHLASLEDGVTTSDEWKEQSGLSIGYPGWGLLYHLALCHLDPQRFNLVVETGTNYGSSSIVLAQAILDSGAPGELRTVEIDEAAYQRAEQSLAAAGVADVVVQHLGNSLERLPEMLDAGVPVRMAFLDGNHEHDHVVREFELVHPHLQPGAVVVLDNTYPIAESGEDSRVFGALHTIVRRFGGNLVNLPYCSWYTPGIAIWQGEPFDAFDRRMNDETIAMNPMPQDL